ncbi:hypothetical protein HDU76_012425, partial [Blyttiomyces sp. JEL0837]
CIFQHPPTTEMVYKASAWGHFDMAVWMAEVNHCGIVVYERILIDACMQGDLTTVKSIRKSHGSLCGEVDLGEAFHDAANSTSVRVVNNLLSLCRNDKPPLARRNSLEEFRRFLVRYFPAQLTSDVFVGRLTNAIHANDVETVRVLVCDFGPDDVDWIWAKMFSLVAVSGRVECLQCLLGAFVWPKLSRSDLKFAALKSAVIDGNVDGVRVLMNPEQNVWEKATQRERTLLFKTACKLNSEEIGLMLLNAGVQNAWGATGDSFLWSLEAGHVNLPLRLLETLGRRSKLKPEMIILMARLDHDIFINHFLDFCTRTTWNDA